MDQEQTGTGFLPAGRTFAAEELVHFAGRDSRSLEDALAEADVLVTLPHAGEEIPMELAPHLAPAFADSPRLRWDLADQAVRAVALRWAELDPKVVLVENPHPRLVRDPDRPRPADLAAQLTEAFRRLRETDPGTPVDLDGVDAVPVATRAGLPVFTPPPDDAALSRLVVELESVAARGLAVYERTRDDLFDRLVAKKLRGAAMSSGLCFFLSLHDQMNAAADPDGALDEEPVPIERMPAVLTLANRGDAQGEPRGREPATLWPALLRSLAEAHRFGFGLANPRDVELNRPVHGGQEAVRFGRVCRELSKGMYESPGFVFGAASAVFRREFLLGDEASRRLAEPGTDVPAAPAELTDAIARKLHASWDEFRRPLPGSDGT
jgi:hypothetical protein